MANTKKFRSSLQGSAPATALDTALEVMVGTLPPEIAAALPDAMPVSESAEVRAASAADDVTSEEDDMDIVDLGTMAVLQPGSPTLKVQYLHPVAKSRSMLRGTDGSAGLDLCACREGCTGTTRLVPGHPTLFGTGVAVAIPDGHVGLVVMRSGKSMREGLLMTNSVSVIDPDFRGEIKLSLETTKQHGTIVELGERVAQLLVVPYAALPVEEVAELPATARGTNGLGSTGA